MADDSKKPLRPWRLIAAELCQENSSERALELSIELEEAYKEQTAPPATEKKAG
jgi:hypothetical protein